MLTGNERNTHDQFGQHRRYRDQDKFRVDLPVDSGSFVGRRIGNETEGMIVWFLCEVFELAWTHSLLTSGRKRSWHELTDFGRGTCLQSVAPY